MREYVAPFVNGKHVWFFILVWPDWSWLADACILGWNWSWWCLYFRVKLVMDSWRLYFRMKLVMAGWCLYFRVSDEKDARGYLQALATKMTEELENLKVGVPGDDVVSRFLSVAAPRKYPVVGFSSHLSVFSPPPHPHASVALLNLRLLLPCFIPVFFWVTEHSASLQSIPPSTPLSPDM